MASISNTLGSKLVFGSRWAPFRWRSYLWCSCSYRSLSVLRFLVPDEGTSRNSSKPPSSLCCFGCLASCQARLNVVRLFSIGLIFRQGKDLLHFVAPLKNFRISTKSDHLPGDTVLPCAALLSFIILICVFSLLYLNSYTVFSWLRKI